MQHNPICFFLPVYTAARQQGFVILREDVYIVHFSVRVKIYQVNLNTTPHNCTNTTQINCIQSIFARYYVYRMSLLYIREKITKTSFTNTHIHTEDVNEIEFQAYF